MSEENVKNFVRNILGCDCAGDVFRHIENEKGVEVCGIRLNNRINVGNRLLVYIVDADEGFLKKLPSLIAAGKKERDGRGFNRFRLVLASDDMRMKKLGFEAFKALGIRDQKIHLHVIGKTETSDL